MKTKTIFREVLVPKASDGVSRTVIIAAHVTKANDSVEEYTSFVTNRKNGTTRTTVKSTTDCILETLNVGIAITNPKDEYNKAIGQEIAKGKAIKEQSALYNMANRTFGKYPVFTNAFVEDFLDGVAKRILNSPDKYIVLSKPKAVTTA